MCTSSVSNCFSRWRIFIRPLLIIIYTLLVIVLVPILIVRTIKDGLNKKDQLILIGALFVLCAVPITINHIVQHLTYYTKPILQKHIIRILWMVPIYAVNGLLGLIYPRYSIYMDSFRECYEAYVIYNFMKYLFNFLFLEMDIEVSMQFKPQVNHFFPLCMMKPWKMGRVFIHNCKHGIFQYVIIRPLTTLIAIICELNEVYDQGSFKLTVAFPYITFINNMAQIIAMYCLVLFYKANRQELKPMKPLPKFLCIKAVVFFSFFQGVLINLLVYYGVIHDMFDSDIKGDYKVLSSRLQDFLICIEMFIAALAHQYSFPFEPFQLNMPQPETHPSNWYRSFLTMLDISDIRQDLTEHIGVVGSGISRGFRSRSDDLENEFLIPAQSSSYQSMENQRKARNLKTYGSRDITSQPEVIGKGRQYRVVEIKETQTSKISNQNRSPETESESTIEIKTESSASSSMQTIPESDEFLGINVRGIENDPISYRNPNV